MGLFRKRDRASRSSPPPPPLPSGPLPLEGAAGRIPASRAVAHADPIVAALDPLFRLVGIVSDTNMDVNGMSRQWDLFFDLPGRASQINAVIAPCDLSRDDDDPPLCMSLRESPFLPEYENEAFVRNVAKELGLTWEEWQAKRVGLVMADRHPALPTPFIDSPRAVAELAAAGIDFVAGPTDIALSTKRLNDGTVVWEAQAGDMRRETAFSDQEGIS